MKTDCDEGCKLEICFEIPTQEQIDAGEEPYFSVDVFDLMLLVEAGGASGGKGGLFSARAIDVFAEAASSPEDADIVADWLESFAAEIRKRGSVADVLPGALDDFERAARKRGVV